MLFYLSLILRLWNVYQPDRHRLEAAGATAIISLYKASVCDILYLIIYIQIKIPEAIFATTCTEALVA